MVTDAAQTELFQQSEAERLRLSHQIEWDDHWQYGVVWRFAWANEVRREVGPPPDGNGWELNFDTHLGGFERRVPSWSDGSIAMLVTHWRRPHPAAYRLSPRKVVKRIRYEGDPHPY